MSHHTNIVRIKSVAHLLRDLKEQVVFVGGSTLSLYASRKTFEVRPTDDVDVIIEILNYAQRAKLEAFKDRGKNDGRTSHDFEDVVYILENRKEIWQEMRTAPNNVTKYLISEFRKLLTNPNLYEWIDCNVERGSPPATDYIYGQLRDFVKQ